MSSIDSDLEDLPDLEDADCNIIENDLLNAEEETPYLDYHSLSLGNVGAFEQLSEDEQSKNNDLAREKRQIAKSLFEESSKTRNKAILMITDAIELNPKSAMYLSTRGQFLLNMGEISAASRDLKTAVERSPDHVTSHRLLSDCYTLLFDYNMALKHVQKAQQLDYSEEYSKKLKTLKSKIQEEEARQKAMEEKMKKEAEETFKPKDKNPTYGNTSNSYGTKQVPKAFQVLGEQSKSLSPEMAKKFMSNETIAKAFSSDDFAKKLDEVAKNPQAAAKYAGDKEFMEAISAVLNCCSGK